MGVEKDMIVAVELGSTAIRAIAGKKESGGTMKILAFAQDNTPHCIRKGMVDNMDRTMLAISKVVKQLDEKLNVHIKRIYIGLSGQSLHSVINTVSKQFETKILIDNRIIDQMKDMNLSMVYPDYEILEVIPQEYRIGNRLIQDPVGMLSEQIEANFLNIIARKSLRENIEKCVQGAGFELAEVLLSPLCAADALLSTNEKRSGCALIDFGADTTTTSIYSNNLLRNLAVIPLGGSNVTADIASCKNMEFSEAEELKLKYGTAYRTEEQESTPQNIKLSFDRSIDEDLLQEIVEARYEEIIINAWNQISKFNDNLLSGLVLCGKASRVPKLSEAISQHTHLNKSIRIAKGLPEDVVLAPGISIPEENYPNTLISLLKKGKENCIGEFEEEEAVQGELPFAENNDNAPDNEVPKTEDTIQEKNNEKKKAKKDSGKKLRTIWNVVNKLFIEED